MLGVERSDDAEAALSDETLAAGAAPWKWKNTKPGYFYLEWAGRDRELWAAPCRSFIQSDEDRAAEVVAALSGEAAPTPAAAAEPVPEDPEDDDPAPGVNPEDPPDNVDPAQPIEVPAAMPRVPFGESRKMPTAAAMDLLRSHIFDLGTAGAQHVKPAELGGVLAQTGLSGSWLYQALRELSAGKEPVLASTQRGVYRILDQTNA